MSSPVYAEDSFGEESYGECFEDSDQELFSGSDGDDSPDFIPQSPKKLPANCISAVRRLFAKSLRNASNAISSVPSQSAVTSKKGDLMLFPFTILCQAFMSVAYLTVRLTTFSFLPSSPLFSVPLFQGNSDKRAFWVR